MSGLVDNHPLSRDFPEFKETIHALKTHDLHFAKQMEKYEALDKEIVRSEQGVEHLSDGELDTLKMQRVQLKDLLHQLLKEGNDVPG